MQEIRLKVRVKWFVSSGFAGWFHSLDNSTFREICIRTPHQWCAYAVDRHQLHIHISEHHMGHQTIMKSIMCWLLIAWHRPQPTNSITILLQHRIPFPFHFCTLRCDECVYTCAMNVRVCACLMWNKFSVGSACTSTHFDNISTSEWISISQWTRKQR